MNIKINVRLAGCETSRSTRILRDIPCPSVEPERTYPEVSFPIWTLDFVAAARWTWGCWLMSANVLELIFECGGRKEMVQESTIAPSWANRGRQIKSSKQ